MKGTKFTIMDEYFTNLCNTYFFIIRMQDVNF